MNAPLQNFFEMKHVVIAQIEKTIAAHKTKRVQSKQIEKYAQPLVTELTNAEASEEEIGEALEDFYSQLET